MSVNTSKCVQKILQGNTKLSTYTQQTYIVWRSAPTGKPYSTLAN